MIDQKMSSLIKYSFKNATICLIIDESLNIKKSV